VKRATIAAILRIATATLACSPAAFAAPATTRPADSPAALVERLADGDPAVRQAAEERLLRLGLAARADTVRASRSDNPAIASRASEILLEMPWFRPDDPVPVRQALADYGRRDEPGRIELLAQLLDLPATVSNPVLERLMLEDPSEDVCWQATSMLQRRMDHQTVLRLRELDPGPTRSAALTLAAQAWYGRSRARSLEMFRRAVASETSWPAYDAGELDVAFDRLCEDAVRRQDFDEAARLRRLHAGRIGVTRDAYPQPVFELFALHGEYGPLAGFDSDLSQWESCIGQPQVLYSLGQACRRQQKPFAAGACFDAAALGSLTATHRLLVARFLFQQGWMDLAERELLALLGNGEADAPISQVNANLLLATIARQRGDEPLAAKAFAAVDAQVGGRSEELQRSRGDGRTMGFDVRSEIEFSKHRAARAVGDDASADEHLRRLVEYRPTSSEIVLEIVPQLRAAGRNDDAAAVFTHAYETARTVFDSEPGNPALQNELAWLCARSGERVEEGLALATKAIADQPDNAAYLDTAAEANFRSGNVDEAIRLESRALQLEPGDKFMTEQLARFNAGK